MFIFTFCSSSLMDEHMTFNRVGVGSIPTCCMRVARGCLFTGAQRQYCIMQDVLASAPRRPALLERYRSGHNEAVLKTVCPYGHMGSNPILSALPTW